MFDIVRDLRVSPRFSLKGAGGGGQKITCAHDIKSVNPEVPYGRGPVPADGPGSPRGGGGGGGVDALAYYLSIIFKHANTNFKMG